MNKGNIYLIPTVLGENGQFSTLPVHTINTIKNINIFIVENIRTARRQIKKLDKDRDINKITFYVQAKNHKINLEKDLLRHIINGKNVGILSEAGMPCIADPGSNIVAYAHNMQINVIPLTGPSSIFLSLMASGFNGQNFSFKGYLPIEKNERKKEKKELEKTTKQTGQTQIFMEAPFRNNQLLQTLIKTCKEDTKLCVATNITCKDESIKTKTINEWKNINIDIHKKPTIFIIGKPPKLL